jgi:hypothetical protein
LIASISEHGTVAIIAALSGILAVAIATAQRRARTRLSAKRWRFAGAQDESARTF